MANSVIGTWVSETPENVGTHSVLNLAVLQLRPDGTFIEGVDLNGQVGSFSGIYFFDPKTQKIAYRIDNAGPPGGPVPTLFHTTGVSSTVFFGNPTEVRLNDDLLFTMKSTGVSLADFVLPSPPRPTTPAPPPGGVRAALPELFADSHSRPFMPIGREHPLS